MKELLEKSLAQKIERLEAFEERMMVRLENVSLRISTRNWLTIFCEVHPVSGTTIKEYMYIECVLYDKNGGILEKKYTSINEDDFFGFEVIEFGFTNEELIDNIGRIRIYPKK